MQSHSFPFFVCFLIIVMPLVLSVTKKMTCRQAYLVFINGMKADAEIGELGTPEMILS